MRRLAWLFVLPSALCQYQPQQQQPQQRYNNPNYNPNNLYGNQAQYNQQNQYNPQQQQYQRGQQNQANQQNSRWQQNQNAQQQGYQQGYQQGAYNGQTGINGQNNALNQQTGRSEVVNTPTRLVTGNTADPTYGAQVDFRLSMYQNNDLSLSNVTTCSCPQGKYCDYLSSTGQNDCKFSFTTVFSSKEQSVQFIQSDFYPFTGTIQSGNWTNAMSFPFPSRPVAVDIFVQHLGVVIHKVSGSLLFFNHLTLVDSFVVDMTTLPIPTQNQNPTTRTVSGNLLGTSLTFSINVQCINGRMGENCDLLCDTNVQTNNVICTDSQGRNTSCQWTTTYRNQVQNCIVCNIVGANGTCAQVLMDRGDSGLVSYAFRTWTIVLGCLLGLALLFILCLIISFIILRNRADPDETPSTAYKQESSYSNGKSASRPLLQDDEWAAAPRSRPIMPERTDDYGNRGHTRDTTTSVSRQEHQV